VGPGDSAWLGEFEIQVVGPQRRYADGNDGSVVLLVRAGGRSVVLPGDIGATAQHELPTLQPDVLLVPHHGAATTDLGWLAETVGSVAVVSVGENTYGHPDPAVVETLGDSGATVLITEELGDISLPLGER
jgi:competence protein ComEC